MLTSVRIRPVPSQEQVSRDPFAALIHARLVERRPELAEHCPEALAIAAHALADAYRAATGRIADIRADRSVRYRGLQLMGERGLQLEDLVAIGHEGEVGEAVVTAILRTLAEACGYALVVVDAAKSPLTAAAAGLVEGCGALSVVAGNALADGHVDAVEAERISDAIDKETAPRVAAWRASR